MLHLLVVDDHPHQLENIKRIVADSDITELTLFTAQSGYEALQILQEERGYRSHGYSHAGNERH